MKLQVIEGGQRRESRTPNATLFWVLLPWGLVALFWFIGHVTDMPRF